MDRVEATALVGGDMGQPVRIKICGVTTPADAVLAARLGADAVGLNLYPPSPRYVEPHQATAIERELPLFVEAVGVFVDELPERLKDHMRQFSRVHTIQSHGRLATEPVDVHPFPLIVAVALKDTNGLMDLNVYLARCRSSGRLPAGVLVDAHVPGLHGGTGQVAPWHLLEGFDPGVPLILAGGLTPDNVAEAVRRVRPYAVDVASGVEASPGRKDAEKMRRFIENALAAIG
jgi:phosphoribosylanthranilate isomerase